MWPVVIMGFLKRFPAQAFLPIAAVVGFIGYTIEGYVSDRYTPASDSILQQRQERLLQNIDSNSTKKTHNPLEVNLSPSLSS